MEKKEKFTKGLLGGGIGAAFVAICFFVFHFPDFWAQLLAIIASAFLGAGATAWLTNMLLENQQKSEEEKERRLALHKTKLKVYSDYVSEMYEALSDNHVESSELIGLRTKLFATIGFYADRNVLEEIDSFMNDLFFKQNESIENIDLDGKMSSFFSGMTSILQKDTKPKGKLNDGKKTSENDIKSEKQTEGGKKETDIVTKLWNKFEEIIKTLQTREKKDEEDRRKEKEMEKLYAQERQEVVQDEKDKQVKQYSNYIENNDQEIKHDTIIENEPQYLEKQVWHFNAWDIRQFEQLDKSEELEEYELSLVEYEENWRTNLLKQVKEGDIIMLFRRGGYGYVGAFKALGWRVFNFEDGKEEIQYFGEELNIITEKDNKDRFLKDVEKYDIYNSKEDGATLCSNIIVKPIAYVHEGVGNPGGVYRRTISRYDSHYAWLLKERFQKNGQWIEE